MMDISQTTAPKSNQLNADDLDGGPRTIVITKVAGNPQSAEQPVAISFLDDGGRPYYPCKSMRRCLVHIWGKDGASYVGKSLTLFRDPGVTWGGMAVGGIRISHASALSEPITMALTASKQVRRPFTVRPLEVEKAKPKKEKSPIDLYAQELQENLKAASEGDVDGLSLFWANTGERRMALNIPDDRLEKMTLAVQKVLNPDAPA